MSDHAQTGMRRRGRWLHVSCLCGDVTPRRRFALTALLAHRRHVRFAARPLNPPPEEQ